MNIIRIIIYFCFINGLLCALHKTKNVLSIQLKDKESSKLYGKMILDELNQYRKIHFFQQKIDWQDELFEQAQQEGELILNESSFGDHDKFEEYDQAKVNDYFTELVVKLVLNDHKVPNKRVFAQLILNSLLQDYKYYIVQDYSKAGISAMHSLEDDEYLVVLHLLQESQKYSCKKALDKGKKPKFITINDKGKSLKLKCDQNTAGGGWTQIANIKRSGRGEALIIPLDDRNLEYTQILFEAKPTWYLNYNFGTENVWDFDGYNFRFNCLRFGDKWYVDRSHDGYNVKYEIYEYQQDIDVIIPATKCFFGGSQQLQHCAKKFIFKAVPTYAGRLNAFSELQSASSVDLHNNIYRFDFKLYVR